MAVIIDIAKDMVEYLAKIQENVLNIKTYIHDSPTISNSLNRSPVSSNGSAQNYKNTVEQIAQHCFPNENLNTSIEVVDFTIRKLSEGNNSHNAGALPNINYRVYANQVLKKLSEPQQCGMFKAFAHVLTSQQKLMNNNKTNARESKPKRKYRKIDDIVRDLLGKNDSEKQVFLKSDDNPIKLSIRNNSIIVGYKNEKYTMKQFASRFLISKRSASTQLYLNKNGKRVSLKTINAKAK